MSVKPIPEGYHTVTPYLIAEDADAVLEFAKKAFGATEGFCMRTPEGKIAHAEFRVGDSNVMLSEACGEWKPMPALLHLYVEDVDAVFKKAVEAGGEIMREPANQFYGDRSGGVRDSSGNQWWISTHVEDVSPEELARRAQQTPAEKKN